MITSRRPRPARGYPRAHRGRTVGQGVPWETRSRPDIPFCTVLPPTGAVGGMWGWRICEWEGMYKVNVERDFSGCTVPVCFYLYLSDRYFRLFTHNL